MFTIFDLFVLVGGLAGFVVGAVVGWLHFGLIGAAAGCVAGALLGLIAGRVPWLLVWWLLRYRLSSSTSEALRERLTKQYYISHLIIGELVSRGEPVESFRQFVLDQLRSEDADVRRFGEANSSLWFPGLIDGDGAAKGGRVP
jgi:hypothetical protein